MRRLSLCFLLALLPGCLSTAPRLSLEVDQGLVRADRPAAGQTVARLLDELAPRVRELLPGSKPEPIEVWVQSRLEVFSGWPLDPSVPAFTLEDGGRIHLQEAAAPELSYALAHELVHSLLGEEWSTLPAVAEEGLADWIQEQLHPAARPMLRADHLAKASSAFGGLRFGVFMTWSPWGGRRVATFSLPGGAPSNVGELDPATALENRAAAPRGSIFQPYRVSVSDSRLYGLGYLVVARIAERRGLLGLRRLCLRARDEGLEQVPASWLLAAAELQGEREDWRSAILERFGDGELEYLAGELQHFLVELLENSLEPFRHALPSDRVLLEKIQPRLALLGGPASVRLERVPGLFDALLSAWALPRGDVPTLAGGAVSLRQPAAPLHALSSGY